MVVFKKVDKFHTKGILFFLVNNPCIGKQKIHSKIHVTFGIIFMQELNFLLLQHSIFFKF